MAERVAARCIQLPYSVTLLTIEGALRTGDAADRYRRGRNYGRRELNFPAAKEQVRGHPDTRATAMATTRI